jgi:hypothetical protein
MVQNEEVLLGVWVVKSSNHLQSVMESDRLTSVVSAQHAGEQHCLGRSGTIIIIAQTSK